MQKMVELNFEELQKKYKKFEMLFSPFFHDLLQSF